MTEIVNTVRLAELQRLQEARDQLSLQLEAIDQALERFPYAHRLDGPVPESGLWQDHLRTPGNERTAAEYDAKVTQRTELQEAIAANIAEARAIEAQPASKDALTVLLGAARAVIRSYEGIDDTPTQAVVPELARVYRILAGEP